MSAPVRAPARAGRGDVVRRAGALLFLVPLFASLAGGAVLAGPPPAVWRLTAADAAANGLAIDLVRHDLGSDAALEVRLPPRGVGVRLLATAADGTSAALADRYGLQQSALVVAHADGSQARVEMPGLLAAGYARGGDWLAALDGHGALWRVEATSGDAHRLADGPFLGTPVILAGGSLLLLSVSSVEAPIVSQLIELDPLSGAITQRADEDLVYEAFPMAGESVAIAAHVNGSTVVREIRDGRDELIADLGPGATQVAVAANGRIAFVRQGRGVFLLDRPGAAARLLAPGSDPAFNASGSRLIVHQDGWSVVLAADGSTVSRFGGDVAFVACGEECGS